MAYHGAKYRAELLCTYHLTYNHRIIFHIYRQENEGLQNFGNFLKDTGLGSHGAQIPAWQAGSTHDTLRCATSALRQRLWSRCLVQITIISPMPNTMYSLRNYLWIIYLYNSYERNINISTFTPQVKKVRPGEVLWLIQAHTVSEWRSNWLLHDNPRHWPGTLFTFASSSSCSPTPLAPTLQPHKPPFPSFQGHVPPQVMHSQLQWPFSSFPLL